MQDSKIAWCNHTLNYWIGCSHAIVPASVSTTGKSHESPECKACYAEQTMDNRLHKVLWGSNGTRSLVKCANPNARKWNQTAIATGDRPRVFCQSLSDTFEKFEGLNEWRMELLNLISECTHIEWLLLSKHLFDRMANGEDWRDLVPESWRDRFPDHVRIGCTGGTQETYDYRVKLMQKIPAKNFVSVEPMLQCIDLRLNKYKVDQIIVGGESKQGKNIAHEFDFNWGINAFLQCRDHSAIAKPAFFFKQAGSNPSYFGKHIKLGDKNGADITDPLIPPILLVQEFPN